MPRLTRVVAAAISGLFLAFACAGGARAIIDGVVDPNTAGSPWAGVGSLTNARGDTFSAVVIAPDAVLTAAHVVAGSAPTTWTFNLNVGGDLTAKLPVASIHVHPDYHGFAAGRDGVTHHDLAVVRLASVVPFTTPVYELAVNAPRPGERLVLVGYGIGGTTDGPSVPANPAVKRVGANIVEWVFQDLAGAGRVELYRFSYHPLPGGSPLEATLATGDSGSPAFAREREGWRLAGINTFVYASPAGRGGGGIALAAYREWILGAATR